MPGGGRARRLDRAGERVADRWAALFVASREPASPLLRGAMGPALRVYLALRLLLDPVVTDCARRVQRFVDVGLRQLFDQATSDGVRRPSARVAIRLQLRAHRAALRPLTIAADPVEHAEPVLHVV